MRVSCLLILCCVLDAALASPDKPSSGPRSAGILYEIWHTGAAWLMNRNRAAGAEALTVEAVIRSDGNLTLGDVFTNGGPPVPPRFEPDIYNTEPALGFYCL